MFDDIGGYLVFGAPWNVKPRPKGSFVNRQGGHGPMDPEKQLSKVSGSPIEDVLCQSCFLYWRRLVIWLYYVIFDNG